MACPLMGWLVGTTAASAQPGFPRSADSASVGGRCERCEQDREPQAGHMVGLETNPLLPCCATVPSPRWHLYCRRRTSHWLRWYLQAVEVTEGSTASTAILLWTAGLARCIAPPLLLSSPMALPENVAAPRGTAYTPSTASPSQCSQPLHPHSLYPLHLLQHPAPSSHHSPCTACIPSFPLSSRQEHILSPHGQSQAYLLERAGVPWYFSRGPEVPFPLRKDLVSVMVSRLRVPCLRGSPSSLFRS